MRQVATQTAEAQPENESNTVDVPALLAAALADPSGCAYVGYFENCFSERWVLQIDRTTRSGELRGDETGWEAIRIRRGRVKGDFIFAPEEQLWLEVCLATVS